MLQTTVFRHYFPNKITSYRNFSLYFSDYTLKGMQDMLGGGGVGKAHQHWLIMTVCRSWHRVCNTDIINIGGLMSIQTVKEADFYWSIAQLLYVLLKVPSPNLHKFLTEAPALSLYCISSFLHVLITVYIVACAVYLRVT